MDRDEIKDRLDEAADRLVEATEILFDERLRDEQFIRMKARRRMASAHSKFIHDLEDKGLLYYLDNGEGSS